MSTETTIVRRCDIFKTMKGTERVRVTIEILEHDGDTTKPIVKEADMGPRARIRLAASLAHGLNPPGYSKVTE